MKIAITSQNFRTITGHGGKARRFLLFDVQSPEEIAEIGRLDLPMEMAMHGFDDRNPHPLDGTDLLITGSAGDGFVARMARRGIRVVRTGETDPLEAIRGCYYGTLKPPVPHDHDHDHEAQGEDHSCGCGH
jgi:predicted Fe-Mo cluster-binding NifX family protein